jgi:hypothetical protein
MQRNEQIPARSKLWKNTPECAQSVPPQNKDFQGKTAHSNTVLKFPPAICVSTVSSW